MNNDFFGKAKTSSSLISEAKILDYLAHLGKAIVISLEKIEYFQTYILDIKTEIEKASNSDIHHFKVDSNGIVIKQVIGTRNLNDFQFHNLIDKRFQSYEGYCFVVDNGMSYMLHNGEIDSNLQSSLLKTKTMQELLNTQKSVRDLEEVFENFNTACKYQTIYREYCFGPDSKIKSDIKEKELRQILLEYLDKHVKGDVQTEFCTDYENDEESVDIYLNDGVQRAIIEVKFSFLNKYYNGSTFYSFSTRIGDGMTQLDKYAMHLAKDRRQVDFGYVYMFYCNDSSDDEITEIIQTKYEELKKYFSSAFFTIYKCTITNNLLKWAKN